MAHRPNIRLNHFIHCIITLAALMAVLPGGGCRRPPVLDDPKTSVYFWRTVLRLDSTERRFLQQHGVQRMYVRFFDIVMRNGEPMPNATLRVNDTLPDGLDIVPTVFMTENCLRSDTSAEALHTLAQRIVKRITTMCTTNDLPEPTQMQMDYDWTRTTANAYFRLLENLRTLLADKGMRLSVTIRMHQLSMPPPPADYGVLMVYNTGSVQHLSDRNPVLDYRDAQPFLSKVGRYNLPLCAAYPCYSWQVLYRGTTFKSLLHGANLDDTLVYRPADKPGRYVVIATRDVEPTTGGVWVEVGDSVAVFTPDINQIRRIAKELEHHRPGIGRQTVLYTLDTKNIQQYTSEEYETLFHP